MEKYLLFLLVALIGAGSSVLIKSGINHSMALLPKINSLKDIIQSAFILLKNPWILAAFCLYVPGLLLYLFILTKFELSYAFPLISAVYIFILLFSWIFLKEDINTLKIIGTLIIILGIILVAKSS